MGIAMIAPLLAVATTTAPTSATMVAMVPPTAIEGSPNRVPDGDGFLCSTGYGDCMRIVPDGEATLLGIFDMDAAAENIPAIPLPAAITNDEDGRGIGMWEWAIRLEDPAHASAGIRMYMVGIIRRGQVSYAGGGASTERLHLFPLTLGNGSAVLGPEVLSLPWASASIIRACFGDDDTARRRGACHDEYEYTGTIEVANDSGAQMALPNLTYTTLATAYPRTARRSQDSSAAPPLAEADLTIWRDPECSYTRTLHYNPATERYEMDRIAPDCSSYTAP